jgi:hypothetical protein
VQVSLILSCPCSLLHLFFFLFAFSSAFFFLVSIFFYLLWRRRGGQQLEFLAALGAIDDAVAAVELGTAWIAAED